MQYRTEALLREAAGIVRQCQGKDKFKLQMYERKAKVLAKQGRFLAAQDFIKQIKEKAK
jgi:hypothetical protein